MPSCPAMAETDRPCRCNSSLMTTSPSLITVPSPPADGDSIGDRFAVRPPGARPGRSGLTTSLGKIQTALLGKITPVSTVVEVVQEEAQEDALRLGGVTELDIFDSPMRTGLRRFPWLLINLGTAVVASLVIAQFEDAID